VAQYALIFDCDGVLADTERDGHLPAFNQTFEEVGVPVKWSIDEYARLVEIGGGKERMATLFAGVLRDTRWDRGPELNAAVLREWHALKTRKYVELVESGALPGRPGIREITAEAAAAGWKLAVASTSAEPSVRAVLAHVVGDELSQEFQVFAGDIVARKKPAPDIYLKAITDLGVQAENVIVVEDSGIGCRAAINAGLTTIVTVSTYTADDDFAGAALVTSSLGEPGRVPAAILDNPQGIEVSGAVTLTTALELLQSRR
jgi:HAD superfamily hydrolase (TIGR01509 family)